jgi:hypothetical protein
MNTSGFDLAVIISSEPLSVGNPNCITGNVTEGSIVASGKMLLTDRQNPLSEEQHDEPEK